MDARRGLIAAVAAAMVAAGVGGTASAMRVRPHDGVIGAPGGSPGGGSGGASLGGRGSGGQPNGGGGGQVGNGGDSGFPNGADGGDAGSSGFGGGPIIQSDRDIKTDVVAIAWD